MTGHGLGPADRVRRRPDFERAYDTGVRVHGRFMTLFVVPNTVGRSRLGVAATRKLGSAVDRNLAKRRSRELFRRHRISESLDIVIVPRRELLDASFATLETDYLTTLDRHKRQRHRPSGQPGRGARRPAAVARV